MADSIAKLSVLITGDTGPLNSSLQRASGNVRTFGAQTERTTSKLSAFNGTVGKTAAGFVTAQVAVAAGRVLWRGLAAGIDSAQRQMDEVAAAQAELAKLTGASVPQVGELTAAYSRLSNVWGSLFSRQAKEAAHALNVLSDHLNALGGGGHDQHAKQLEKIKQTTEALKAQEQIREEAARKQREAMEHLRHRAESLSESLRKPTEVYADTVAELRELGGLGMLDPAKVTAGITKAKEELLATAKSVKQLQDTYRPVGAAERYTQSAASAISESRATAQAQLKAEQEQIEIGKKQLALQKEANELLRKKPQTFTFIRGNL